MDERTELLKKMINDTGINLKAFSKKAGIPYTTLRSILDRGIGNANVDNVIKVCKALNITLEDLEINSNEQIEAIKNINTIAAHLEGENLTDDEINDIINYVNFIKSKRKNI